MLKKKLEVVELNKKEEKIILEEKQSPWIIFYKKHQKLIFITALILSLTILILGLWVGISSFLQSEELIIKSVSIDTSLTEENSYISGGITPMTSDTAKKLFNKNEKFRGNGEVLLIQTVESEEYIIRFYSDGTAIKVMKKNNLITRISALENGKYAISKDGIINSKATISDVNIIDMKTYSWGKVTYFSDGSAEISDAKINMFVRNSSEIYENYISNNKVTYLKETKNIGKITLNYYYDGTIEIIKNNKSYLVRNESDLNITNNDVTFKNNNQAEVKETKRLSNAKTIDYYTDGGAIIRDGSRTISVRKSNSIIIKNNKIYEIVDNIYVEKSKVSNDGNIIYYTNGAAVIKYNGKTEYVEENSNIKYNQNNQISNIENDTESLTKETNIKTENVKIFEMVAVITTENYIAIIPKENVVYDDDGSIKELIVDSIIDDDNTFTITNNTNEAINYRVVIEKSDRTNLDAKYIRYQLSVKDLYIEPQKLNSNVWTTDKISSGLNITGTNYILLDSTLEAHDTANIKLMLWTDYETIPNSMQNKYFYGTIRVYAWTEK